MPELTEIASGLEFPEGPIAMPDGTVLVVEIHRGTLTRVFGDGKTEVVAEISGGPNGAAVGPDGAVYIANNGGFKWREAQGMLLPTGEPPDDYAGGRIERVDLDASVVTLLYKECDGHPLCGPNDLVFDAQGNFWFTDTGKTRERDSDHGGLYYGAADGSFIKEVVYPLQTPNGVGLSPEGDRVYVAETLTGRVWYWEITGPGEVAIEAPLGGAGGTLLYAPEGLVYYDSLAVEADGRVDVATLLNGGVTVITPDRKGEHIPTPDPVTTNICFGGDDLKTAYITLSATGKLVSVPWPRPGLKLAY